MATCYTVIAIMLMLVLCGMVWDSCLLWLDNKLRGCKGKNVQRHAVS